MCTGRIQHRDTGTHNEVKTGSRRVAYLSVLDLCQDNLQSVGLGLQRSTKCLSGSQYSVFLYVFFFYIFPCKSPLITLFCIGNHCASPRLNFSFSIWHSHLYCFVMATPCKYPVLFCFFFFFQTNDCLLQNVKFIANPACSSFIRTFTLERHTWLNVWTSKCTAEATVVGQINVALCTNCV